MTGRTLYPGAELLDPDDGVDYKQSVSGVFESSSAEEKLILRVDIDKTRPFSKALDFISGTLVIDTRKSKPLWSGDSSAAYFRSQKGDLSRDNNSVEANISIVLSDGGKLEGQIKITFRYLRNHVLGDVSFIIASERKVFVDVPRTNQFFKEIRLDIDYVEKVIWPVVELNKFEETSSHMTSRQLSITTAFEDAGLKLYYDSKDSQQIVDPTPDTRWSKADMYAVMEDYFDNIEHSGESIWCLLAVHPPDSRFMGFSFDNNGKHGFGLFTGHTSFNGMDDVEDNVKAQATRRFLHYMVHECGHCLGLSHPFELGNPHSLSWMNYAWKYDAINEPGSFYNNFYYSFSDEELLILRHQPDKVFKDSYSSKTGSQFSFLEKPKSDALNYSSVEADEEDELDGVSLADSDHRLNFDISFRPTPFSKGGAVELKASLRNIGSLPCKIEPDLTLGGGNLTVFVTNPAGAIQIAKPFVTGIDAPTRKYVILGKEGSLEHSSVFNDVVPLIQGNEGAIFDKVGTYTVTIIYEAGEMKVTSNSAQVIIIDDTENDEATKAQLRVATSLDGTASESTSKVVDYWKQLIEKPMDVKINRLHEIVLLLQGLSRGVVRATKENGSFKGRSKTKKLQRVPALRTARELIRDTADMVAYCRKKFTDDALSEHHYSRLVLGRAALLQNCGDTSTAEIEANQLLADLISRDTGFDFVKRVSSDWERIRYPEKKVEEREKNIKYQQRVEKLIFWVPSDDAQGKMDKSGIGLDMPFNNFDDGQLRRSFRFAEGLELLEKETNDLDAVLDYAEAVLESREVNHEVYQWAIETYIVQSKLAKKHKVRYPDPPKRDESMMSSAAVVETKREGSPQESWMNYWRCDADFNFHHRHWHAVYRGRDTFHETKRQGELFGYMHSQLLARYDAERESWGLPPVKPYEFDEVEPHGFHAGWEFHEDRRHRRFAPRPDKQVWRKRMQAQIRRSELNIIKCFEKGFLPRREFGRLKVDSNLAGHIIESSSPEWHKVFGSMHNDGHMAFTNTKGIPEKKTTYMGSTLTAVRDPIFFRWHKRVDNLFHNWNNRVREEVGADVPGVIIEPSDALILPGTEVPKGFADWNSNGWVNTNFKSDKINTFLRNPIHAYEWDNKLEHEPFSYHIRIRRKPNATGELALTLRVFICQERHINNRRKWIEMDKFVSRLRGNEDHVVLQRLDRESSVIKRIHDDLATSKEESLVETVPGNCECGWPYKMMLPRGFKGGEKWVLGVIATDNNVDGIDVRTSCGSMSYCGTRDQEYPDRRTMGYPFASNISINKRVVSISEAAEKLSNFCISPFEIHNDVGPIRPIADPLVPSQEVEAKPQIVWVPFSIEGDSGQGDYRSSRIVGRMRVLLDDRDFRKISEDRVRIRFKGRVESSYAIRDVKLSLRRENTLDIDENCNVDVFFNGSNEGIVSENGATSDEIFLPVKTAPQNDYFVTFTLTSPGCYTSGGKTKVANTYFVLSRDAAETTRDDNWEKKKSLIKKRFRSLYCVECLLSYKQ